MVGGEVTETLAAALNNLRESDEELDNYLFICDSKAEDCPALPEIKLLYLRFEEDTPREDAIVEFLLDSIINYAIPRKKRDKAFAKVDQSRTGSDTRPFARLHREAKNAFLQYDADNTGRLGEVGELLAYCIAERHLGAAQIAAKLSLKTNNNMPVHGLDGIHAKFDSGYVTLYFLESKLKPSANDAAKEYSESVANFSGNRKQYLKEFNIITDLSNLNSLPPEHKQEILDYFDVYSPKFLNKKERHVGVLCYSEKDYEKKLKVRPDSHPTIHEDNFRERYRKKYLHHQDALRKHLEKNSANVEKCSAYFVALPSVENLREKFGKAING